MRVRFYALCIFSLMSLLCGAALRQKELVAREMDASLKLDSSLDN